MTKNSAADGYSQRRRLLAKSSLIPGVATVEPVRERPMPRQEVAERLWWAIAEALNSDKDASFNDLRTYPVELAALYADLRPSLGRFDPTESRAAAVEAHAKRWRLRPRDVHDSLRLAHIEESTTMSFRGPRLAMPLVFYKPGPHDDLVLLGPQHQDPTHLVRFARRRVRVTKGWTLRRIAEAEGVSDWRVIQSGLRAWAALDREAESGF